MSLVFRPTAAGAVGARCYAAQLAASMQRGGAMTRRVIVDGVLLVAKRAGDAVIVDAVLLDGAFVSMYTFPQALAGGLAPVVYPAVRTNKKTMELGGWQSTDFWLHDYLAGSWAMAGDAFAWPVSGSIGRATSVPVASLRAKASMFPRSGLSGGVQRNDQVIRVYNATPTVLRNDVDAAVRVERTDFGTADTTRLAGFLMGFSAWGFPVGTDRLNALFSRAALRTDKAGVLVATRQPNDVLVDPKEGWVMWFGATVGTAPTTLSTNAFKVSNAVLPAELAGNTTRDSDIEPLAVVTTSDTTASFVARVTAFYEAPPGAPYNTYGYVCIDISSVAALSATTLFVGENTVVTGSSGIHTRRPGNEHLPVDDMLILYVNDGGGTAVPPTAMSVYVVRPGGEKTDITPAGYFVPRGVAESVGGSPNGQVVFDAGSPLGRYRYGVNPLGASICACGDGLLAVLCVPTDEFYSDSWALKYKIVRADTLAEVYSSSAVLTVPWQAVLTVSSVVDAKYDVETGVLTHGELLLAVARPHVQTDTVRGLYSIKDGVPAARIMQGTSGYPLEQFTDMVYVSDTLSTEKMYQSAFASW